MGRRNLESEMEEGEIIDELDDLSDISSSEEFSFLRERVSILESYNNVLERQEAKLNQSAGTKLVQINNVWQEVPVIDVTINNKARKLSHTKTERKRRRKSSHSDTGKRHGINHHFKGKPRKKSKCDKEELQICIISETSDASGVEDINKKISLANAVQIQSKKLDKTSLKERLMKMTLNNAKKRKQNDTFIPVKKLKSIKEHEHIPNIEKIESKQNEPQTPNETVFYNHKVLNVVNEQRLPDKTKTQIELKLPNDPRLEKKHNTSKFTEKKILCHENNEEVQYDLITKDCETLDPPLFNKESEEEEDSDTQELRLICLKSAALKNAIELKQKEKFEKRLKNSSQLENNSDIEAQYEKISNGNTDIESVDMDTDMSDNEVFDDKYIKKSNDLILSVNETLIRKKSGDDLDCDLLRSKLLMEVKNKNNDKSPERSPEVACSNADEKITPEKESICQLRATDNNDVDLKKKDQNQNIHISAQNERSYTPELPKILDKRNLKLNDKCGEIKTTKSDKDQVTNKKVKEISIEKNVTTKPVNPVIPEKEKDIKNDLIIITNDSDSETEATKNLTKMHNKLVPTDFQKRLDFLLKATRQIVENEKPALEQQKIVEKTQATEKFIPKAVDHLPLSAQKEYNDLVKRIAELEKKKKARNLDKTSKAKDSNNVPLKLEEKISDSRKNIAEESAQLLTLKEDGKKLVQRHKMLSIELINLGTAIANNKKKTRLAQTKLSNYQTYHQLLLKKIKQSGNGVNNPYKKQNRLDNTKKVDIVEPARRVIKTSSSTQQKTKKCKEVSRVETDVERSSNKYIDITKDKALRDPRLKNSQRDNNKNTVRKPESTDDYKSSLEEKSKATLNSDIDHTSRDPRINNSQRDNNKNTVRKPENADDYKSPLDAMSKATWNGDPHGILCPFEVSGICKDSACKFLHSSPHLIIPSSP